MIPGNANPLLLASAAAAAGAGDSGRSLRFNSGDSAYLSRTPSSAGNRRTWTFATWIKLSKVATSDLMVFSCRVSGFGQIQIGSGGTPHIAFNDFGTFDLRTNRLMRDLSGWFHLCCVFDSTNSTSGDRARIYVNGVRETDFSTETYPSQNAEASWNRAEQHSIGSLQPSYANYFDGYMADIYFIDGSALDPVNNFIEADSNGVYQVKEYTGTFGTNGFHLLDFANESTIGHDSSGNNNDFTATNFSDTAGAGNDVLFDFPQNGSGTDSGAGGEVNGNYCTFNPIDSNQTHSNGNLFVTCAGGTSPRAGTGTIAVSSGKYYYEITVTESDPARAVIGFVEAAYDGNGSTIPNANGNSVFYFGENGNKFIDGTSTSYGASYGNGDVIGVALNLDDDEITFYKNGTSQGTITTKTFTGAYKPAVGRGASSGSTSYTLNAGQRAFTHAAPSGFKTLNTASLPTPTIADGTDYFASPTWTGDGGSSVSVTTGFEPDLIWIKQRNKTYYHQLYDAVRGYGSGKALASNANVAEGYGSPAQYGYVSATSSTGFTGTAGSGTPLYVNENNTTYVAWCWDAGSSTVSNTDGSITSSVRANQTAGFSICTYTGSTGNQSFGHGLNTAPKFIAIKNRSSSANWFVMVDIGETYYKYGHFNTTDALANATAQPVSNTTVTLGNNNAWFGANGDNYVAYCFAPVAGYSAFGSYTGNASTDGPFVALSFRPALIIIKRSSGTGNWVIKDSTRATYNPDQTNLFSNLSNAETTEYPVDFLSNGFKVREGTYSDLNASGSTYIYIALAENPFQANGGLAR